MRNRMGVLVVATLAFIVSQPAAARPPDETYLQAAQTASAHDLDSTAAAIPLPDWIQRAVGAPVPIDWEVNDCGETSDSPADSSTDYPVCAEGSVVLSGSRVLRVSVIVGTEQRGVIPPPEIFGASIAGPDTSMWLQTLAELDQYLALDPPAVGDSIAYLDGQRDVHVVTRSKRDVRITKDGRYRDAQLSPNGEWIGALVLSTVRQENAGVDEEIEVAKELLLYQEGRVLRRIGPQGFIRAWGFANGGKAVAIYSGALHFAGFYSLFDVETTAMLGRAEDPVTDASPEWVRALAP